MPTFQIDIEKSFGAETWTNVYHVIAATIADANSASNAIVTAEQPMHNAGVSFLAKRIRQVGPGHVGAVVPLSVSGTASSSGPKLPLFNVCRVDFQNGTARPSRKYLRGAFGNSALGSDFTFISAIDTAGATYVTAILAVTGICDPQGRALTAGASKSKVAMHQLRRGNKRPTVLP